MATGNVVVTVPEREIIAGRDGFDPIIESEPILGGHRVTIMGRSTMAAFQVMDGVDGINGVDGRDGVDGTDGLSAYQQAVAGGYQGTEAQFNEELGSFKALHDQAVASAGAAAESAASIQSKADQIDANTDAIADLNYKPVDITSFTASPNQVEIGTTVTEVVLSWEINKTPDTLALDGAALTPASSGTETQTDSITERKVWTLDATDTGSPSYDPASDRATATLDFLSKVYWGCGSESAFSGDQDAKDAFINGLTGVLTTRRQRTVLFTPSGSQYLYFAIPSSLCTGINFIVRSGSGAGFALAYNTLATGWGHKNNTPAQTAVDYSVYRSTNSFSSAISIEIT